MIAGIALHAQHGATSASSSSLVSPALQRATHGGGKVPVIAIVGDSAGTERTHCMIAFDAAHPAGADFVVVPALTHRERPAIDVWLRAQATRGGTMVSMPASVMLVERIERVRSAPRSRGSVRGTDWVRDAWWPLAWRIIASR